MLFERSGGRHGDDDAATRQEVAALERKGLAGLCVGDEGNAAGLRAIEDVVIVEGSIADEGLQRLHLVLILLLQGDALVVGQAG